MSESPRTLQIQLAQSPWPLTVDPVIFLLDASRSFEQRTLKSWIRQHQGERNEPIILCLDLADDRKALQTAGLAHAIQKNPHAVIAPVRLSWLPTRQSPRSGPRLNDLLRAGDSRPPSWLAHQVARLNPSRIHLTIGEPGHCEDMGERFLRKTGVSSEENMEDFATFVARQAAVVLDLAERKLTGGRYKVPRYVLHGVRGNADFKARLAEIAAHTGRPLKEIRSEASEYIREMVSVPTRFWLDVWAKICKICLGLGYEPELQYKREELEQIRHIVRHHPSALLWTHKTYIDGFVVPKILFDNDFPMPHFFGGANLNIPVLGFLLRRAGGIFIRRSFQDNEVYKLSLKQYIGYLMEKRFPMTWSFEGTRSRLGKLMPPKYGLLKYVLEGAHQAGSRDIHIIPVSVSYDLVRDAEEYAREQSGVPKAPESLSWLVRYIKSLTRPMGKIHVDFGEPVILSEAPAPDDQLALSKIAFQVAVEANRVTPLTFPAIVSAALLGAFPRALTEKEILRDITAMTSWAVARGVRLSPDFETDFARDISEPLSNMMAEGIITRYEGGPETVYGIADGQAPIASFYRNTIVHFFINRAIAELALLAVHEYEGSEPLLDVFWSEVMELRDLFKFEFFYPDSEAFRREIDEELSRDIPDWQRHLASGGASGKEILDRLTLKVAHLSLTLFAEAYSIGADILARNRLDQPFEEAAFIDQCMRYGKQAYLQRRISSEASLGKILFGNAWKMLESRDLIQNPAGRLDQAQRLNQIIQRLEVIRALSIAERGASTLRDKARGAI